MGTKLRGPATPSGLQGPPEALSLASPPVLGTPAETQTLSRAEHGTHSETHLHSHVSHKIQSLHGISQVDKHHEVPSLCYTVALSIHHTFWAVPSWARKAPPHILTRASTSLTSFATRACPPPQTAVQQLVCPRGTGPCHQPGCGLM